MARCSKCESKLDHSRPEKREETGGVFWFECPVCDNREKRTALPENYFGRPLTPMGDPYGYEDEDDYL